MLRTDMAKFNQRVDELTAFIELCKPQRLEEDSNFRDFISRAQVVFTKDDADCAAILAVSRGSVSRWRRGYTLPLSIIRRFASATFESMAKKDIRTLEAPNGGQGTQQRGELLGDAPATQCAGKARLVLMPTPHLARENKPPVEWLGHIPSSVEYVVELDGVVICEVGHFDSLSTYARYAGTVTFATVKLIEPMLRAIGYDPQPFELGMWQPMFHLDLV